MKKIITTLVPVLILIIGASVFFYPTVSDYLNRLDAYEAMEGYDKTATKLSDEEKAKLRGEAEAYNKGLLEHPQHFLSGEPESQKYIDTFNVDDRGMIAYVSVKKLGVGIPVYHGTSEELLQTSAGHLEGSSFPIGGESTHAVLTGHTGLPSAKLFTDLDKMEIGDTFAIKVLDEVHVYTVERIVVVLPSEQDQLKIEEGRDLVTLVTCTPYGVNTHRLFVTGVRTDDESQAVQDISDQIVKVSRAPIYVAAAVVLAVLLIIIIKVSRRKKES